MTTTTAEISSSVDPALLITSDVTPAPKKPKPYQLTLMDSIEWLSTLPDDSVDLMLSDPPYESLEKWRNVGTTTRLGGAKRREAGYDERDEWFHVFPNSRFPKLLEESFRVLKPRAHMYIHCDETTRDVIKPMMEHAGFTFHKSLIWDKAAIGMGYHWRARYEFILFASKGKKSRGLSDLGLSDVLRVKRLKGPQFYPTQKPLRLSTQIVHNASAPGDVVVDPFMGAGTTGVAAIALGRKFWGCDIEQKALDRAAERVKASNIHRKSMGTPEVLSEKIITKKDKNGVAKGTVTVLSAKIGDTTEIEGKGPDRETAEENLLENYRMATMHMLGL